MFSTTFYRRDANARGAAEGRAVGLELNKAVEYLQRVLRYEEGYSKDTVALIDDVSKRLQILRDRLQKHRELERNAKKEEGKLIEVKNALRRKVDEIERSVADINLERANTLAECDKFRRDIATTKRILQVRVHGPDLSV